MGMMSQADKMRMQTLRGQGCGVQFSNSNNSCV